MNSKPEGCGLCRQIIAGMALLFLIVQIGLSWKEHTHKDQLTPLALNLIRLRDAAKYWKELARFLEYMKQGAWDEDFPVGLNAIRANNHYFHAPSGGGLSDSPFLGLGDPDVDALEWAEKNSSFNGREEFRDGVDWHFRNWGWTESDVGYGDMSWENAILRYDYLEDSKKLAYYTLGFILHLLQDMGCPEHVHDDPHGASGYTGFEWWVYEKWAELRPALDGLQIKKLGRLRDFFSNLSEIGYSANRFQGGRLDRSDPDAVLSSDLGKMFIVRYNPERAEWLLENPEKTTVLRIVVFDTKSSNILNVDFEWNWGNYRKNPLWTKGHDEGEWWPTWMETDGSLNDDEGYYYVELSGDLPGTPFHAAADPIRHLYPRAYLPTPRPSVESQCLGEEWKVTHAKGQHLYSLIGRAVFPAIVEHTAGLVEHFCDIVNHPPYVESVEVASSRGAIVSRWENREEKPTGRMTVKKIESRELIADKASFVGPGEVSVRVIFSEPVDEVRVQVGRIPLTGAPGGEGHIWTGRLKIEEKGPKNEVRPISIAARDRDNHYGNTGSALDSRPGTPARRVPGDDDYEWLGYESGEDRNHELRIKREHKELPEVRDKNAPIRIMVRHPSVVYCDGKREDLEVSWLAEEKLTYPVRILFQPHKGWVCPYGGRFSRLNLSVNKNQVMSGESAEQASRSIERFLLKGALFCSGFKSNPQAKSFEMLYEVTVIDSRGRQSAPRLVPHTCIIERKK